MNILYLVPAISFSSKGILKKQYDKLKAFEKAGCHVSAYFFSEDLDVSSQEGNIFHFPLDTQKVKRRYSKKIIWRILPYLLSKHVNKTIYNTVLPVVQEVDLVYIRYSGTDINAVSLLKEIKKRGKMIAFEYNGNHLYDEGMNVKASPSFFTYYRYLNEKFFQKKIALFADILIGVTDELTDFYSELNRTAVKYTLSNGVDVNRFKARSQPTYDNLHIKFLFLSGSVNYWHGLDRFLNGLKEYSGNRKISLTVAGPISPDFKTIRFKNPQISVSFMESVEDQALDELVNTHHVGIGSLALHRMSLAEASVLKVREYIARGIPFILSYIDTDLKNSLTMKPFYHKVPANESAIDIPAILEFSDTVLAIENYSSKLRAAGIPLIDYQPKISRLIEVFNQALKSSRKKIH